VKVVNDAALQAMGSYQGGKMLFLGLGTGLGSALIVDGEVEPMELGHLPYKKGTYEVTAKKSGDGALLTCWSASLPHCSPTRQ
jgi:polyphosphate glucokinase